MTQAADIRTVGLLLAGGRGRRFDASGQQDKLLQALAGESAAKRGMTAASESVPQKDEAAQAWKPVAARACAALGAGTQAVLAVIRPDAPEALRKALHDAGAMVTVCPDADEGMGHSLAHAMREARVRWPHLQAVLVMPADMPWVRDESVRAIARAVEEQAVQRDDSHPGIVIALTPLGERGHPVGFDARHFHALQSLRGDAGARSLLARLDPIRIFLDDPGIVRDVDTPEDLETP
jgi:molybdenum cofactor cytidylyltransferase